MWGRFSTCGGFSTRLSADRLRIAGADNPPHIPCIIQSKRPPHSCAMPLFLQPDTGIDSVPHAVLCGAGWQPAAEWHSACRPVFKCRPSRVRGAHPGPARGIPSCPTNSASFNPSGARTHACRIPTPRDAWRTPAKSPQIRCPVDLVDTVGRAPHVHHGLLDRCCRPSPALTSYIRCDTLH
jgi:hypothetical protein